MTLLIATHLSNAMFEGAGLSFPDVVFGSPDYKMLRNLETNVYHFSAAKNYQQLKQYTLALKDSKGVIRPWAAYKAKAKKINKIFNHSWLKTEYQDAIIGSNAAARWKEYEEDKDVMPFLKYVTVGDDRVRPEHVILHGVVRRVDDPFWDTYYPPNGHRDRCGVEQQAYGTITNKITYPEVPVMFKVNLGKQQLAFPKGHPYFSKSSLRIKKQISKNANQILTQSVRNNGLNLALNKLLAKKVSHPEAAVKIGFNTSGIKRAINQPHKHYIDKVRLLPTIDKVLEKAVYLRSAEYKGLDRNIKSLHYYEFMMNNEKSYIIVKEVNNGELSLYTVTDKIK
jgi:SPP1 gp7 family putative phage head morphogenesis protein